MAGVIEKQARRWTYEEYYKLDDGQRYEIIDGDLLMAPSPDVWHQDWISNLHFLLRLYFAQHRAGRLFIVPFDVVLDAENTVQPDLIFVAAANAGIIESRAIFGAPDLVVELLSPSSIRRDRHVKKALYARFGVKEYWIGDPANKEMEILTLRDGRYQRLCAVTEKGKLVSKILPGLELDLADIQSRPNT
jgi:Uma2 family endonuclease